MPATYAHYSFGKDCLSVLNENILKKIMPYQDIYFFGVHGPDIFFYYEPMKKNEINQFGQDLHHKTGKEVFRSMKMAYKNYADKDAMLAYILGFLSHYMFDSSAHSYIEKKQEVSKISHNKIESEYEAYLIRKDGRTPSTVDRTKSLHPSAFNARIISYFYPFEEKEIYKTLRGQVQSLNLLHSATGIKKQILRRVLKVVGVTSFIDLFVDNKELEGCRDSNLRLDTLRKIALHRFSTYVNNLLQFLEDEEPLDSYFDKDFSSSKDYQSIVVLPYEEELLYEGEKYE